MRRARAARAAPVLAVALALGACGGGGEPPRPNALIYLVDTLRADHLGPYGYPRDTAPRLARFARDAVLYERAYSPSSWTRPAVASLLSGLGPDGHGAVGRASRLAGGVRLLGEHLHPLGYHTAAFVTNPNVLPVWGFERGFDAFYDVESVERSARADRVNAVVFEHLAGALREPFFLYVHTRDPHGPYDPPEPFGAAWIATQPEVPLPAGESEALRRERDAYDGEIAFNDHHFGALLDRLEARGLYRDALVVFTSDHGEEFRDHGGTGHGRSLFGEVVRVPLLVKYPGNRGGGTRVSAPVSLLDVAPTVLAVAGAAPPAEVEGRDLRAVAADAAAAPRPVYLDLRLTTGGRRHVQDGVVLGNHKWLEVAEPAPGRLLYDLATDPAEQRNLAAERPEVAAQLARVLQGFRARSRGGLHLWVINAGDASRRAAEGTLRTDGRFADVRPLQLEEGDRVWTGDGGRSLHFRVALENRPNPIGQPPRSLVDDDRIAFAVEPDDATLEVASFSVDGEAAPVFLGRDRRPAGALPRTLDARGELLRVERMEALFPASRELSLVAPLGAYLGAVPAVAREDAAIDPDLAARLRALGYGDGPPAEREPGERNSGDGPRDGAGS